jgi:drug/metabolite transporter (DMT)-like permease
VQVFLPLIAAVIYVVGALLLKRASDLGADVWRTMRIINYATAVASLPVWLLGGTIPSPSLWWQPTVAAVLFFSGQVFTLLALNIGDVSVATPVLGLKILLVALLSVVLTGDPVGARLWTAAALSTVAIALLNIDRGRAHARVGTTIVLAALGAASYACFDVVMQKWSFAWGAGRIVPLAMVSAAVYSIPLRLFNRRRADDVADLTTFAAATAVKKVGTTTAIDRSRPYAPWLIAGAISFALQGLTFITSITLYKQATVANVLYSSRGLWSVVGVWAVGHWFLNREQHLGSNVLVWRFIGAVLMMAAIVMVLG